MTLVSIKLLPDETGFYREANVQPGNMPVNQSHTVVDDPIGANDGDSSFLGFTVDSIRTSLKFPAPNLSGAANILDIDHVDVHLLGRRTAIGTGPPNYRLFVYDNGSQLLYDHGLALALTTSYADYKTTFTTNPLSGSAWDKNHFNARRIEFGMFREPEGFEQAIRFTQVYIEIWYNPATWSTQPPATGSWGASPTGSGTWITAEHPGGSWTKT